MGRFAPSKRAAGKSSKKVSPVARLRVSPAKAKPKKVSPAKVAPAKAKPKKVSPAKVAPAKAKPKKVSPAKVAPAKAKPKKVSPAKAAPAKAKPKKVSPAKAAPAKAKPKKAAPAKATPAKAKPKKAAPAKAAPAKAKPKKAAPAKAAPAKAKPKKKPPVRKAPPTKAKPRKPPVKKAPPRKKRRRRGELPLLAERSRQAEVLMQDRLVQLQDGIALVQPGLDMGIQTFVNLDGTVDGELRISNLPSEWREIDGVGLARGYPVECPAHLPALPAAALHGGSLLGGLRDPVRAPERDGDRRVGRPLQALPGSIPDRHVPNAGLEHGSAAAGSRGRHCRAAGHDSVTHGEAGTAGDRHPDPIHLDA